MTPTTTAPATDTSLLSEADLRDIQGLVIYGTRSPFLRYHFFKVHDQALGHRFVGEFVNGPLRATPAGSAGDEALRRLPTRLYVGFTSLGLRALGVPTAELKTFPEAFRVGAKGRAAEVGDSGPSAPERWSLPHDEIHLAVMLYSRTEDELNAASTALQASAQHHDVACVQVLDGRALRDTRHPSGQQLSNHVHFNFSDGIGQPALMGVRDGVPGQPPVPPGMFVLGHKYTPPSTTEPQFSLANEPVPGSHALGFNGTFGAFRLLEQDCDAFEQFLDDHSDPASPMSRELVAARMCGRWRTGDPLTRFPNQPGTGEPDRHAQNDFDYRPSPLHPNAVHDATGALCPIGSHIRRANPRSSDVLGAGGHLIRLIRRGMPYGPPHVRHDGVKRGMLGLFLCANLQRQFEFVQKHWINDGLFARGLPAPETDPMVGSRFVTTRGAAYLFFPSLTGLGYLANLAVNREPDRAAPELAITDRDRIQFIVKSMEERMVPGRRDAHPKNHGLVQAFFEVLDGLAPHVRHGLFAEPKRYKAYIRFSNGSPRVINGALAPDYFPDVRGMSIKLFGVEGDKALPNDEKHTHDFVLASHPVFFTTDLGNYLVFLQTAGKDLAARFPHLIASFRNHESPLTTSYFSQTPFVLGAGHVKYVASPIAPAERKGFVLRSGDPRRDDPHYLRTALAATLREGEATFTFGVQVHTEDMSLHDATEEWTADPIAVARITIPMQEIVNAGRDAFVETISMNPWHCLEANRPFGGINDARREAYLNGTKIRHNGVLPPEPNGESDF